MVYPDNFEERIGYDIIRRQCMEYCTTSGARGLLDRERFSTSSRDIARRQDRTEEMRRILGFRSGVPQMEFFELEEMVDKARVEGTFLDVDELQRMVVTLRSANEMGRYILSLPEAEFQSLRKLTSVVRFTPWIVEEAARLFDAHGQIVDSASERLSAIRRDIRAHEGQAERRLQALLRSAKEQGLVDPDAAISIRDGRQVIPVPAVNKRKVQGFIQDESSTGKTFYIEPVEVVELNNALKELLYEERREIVAILTAFTRKIRIDADSIDTQNMYASILDLLRAKARWALENDAVRPVMADPEKAPLLVLRNACHPILRQTLGQSGRRAVPLSASLDAEKRMIVVSGPNAGGKSVCLKTFGLLQYMFQCGMPVTADADSEFPIFASMYIDIGDEQSIENDLSTYSSHLRNMRAMVEGASDRTLVLIDEFGSGTEPRMGGAIAEAVLEELLQKGCYGVVTTHYSNIKYFAASHPGVENAAMAFDVEHITPLFELETGKPGSSFAEEMARKTGLPERIIASAREKAGQDHVDMERQLREIARDRHYWASKREHIRQTDRHVEQLETRYAEELSKIREERRTIIHNAKAEAREIVSEANRRIESTIRDIREAQAERELTRMARQELERFRAEVEAPVAEAASDPRIDREMEKIERRKRRREERKAGGEKSAAPEPSVQKPKPRLEVGSKVRLAGQNGVGEIRVLAGKRARVLFGQMITTVETARLESASEAEFRAQAGSDRPRTVVGNGISERRAAFRPSMDLRGMRVAEALDKVRGFLDDALMIGVRNVTILHGKGTGALKEEIRRYLRSLPEVRSCVDDHPDRGGSGITLVEFDI